MWARSRTAGSHEERRDRSKELRSWSDKTILVVMARFLWDVVGSATTHHRAGPLHVQWFRDRLNIRDAFPHARFYLARLLVERGVVVVSGLGEGIDTAAH